MCGIAGFVGMQIPCDEAARRVRAMCDAIVHRGPDSDGYHIADGVALGMRRLSIIDVSGGQQPISNEDGSITVVCAGNSRPPDTASGHTVTPKCSCISMKTLDARWSPDYTVCSLLRSG